MAETVKVLVPVIFSLASPDTFNVSTSAKFKATKVESAVDELTFNVL